jgi:ABC-type antimicrobial peptide transport system permease subunit
MIRHYLTLAYRNILRNKVFSIIITSGLSIGMATSVLILLWVLDEFSYDRFHENIDRLYCVIEKQDYSDGQVLYTNNTPFALREALQQNYPEVSNVTRTLWMGERPMAFKDNVIRTGPIAMIDPEFLEIFSFEVLRGDPKAIKDPNTILITKKIAEIFFGEDDPIGKSLKMDGQYDFSVGAVLENVPDNSTFQFNILMPFVQMQTIFERDINSWGNNWPRTTVLLKEGTSVAAFEEKIKNLCKDNGQENTSLFVKALYDDHLYSYSGENNRVQYVYLFIAIGIIILLIASVNFVNLSTTRSEERSKEVGIRKVIGAKWMNLVRQFFTENLLYVMSSLIISVFLTAVLIPLFNEISGKNLKFDPFQNPDLIILFASVGLFAVVLSAIYPSLVLSSFSPVMALKSSLVVKRQKKLNLRSVLVVIQFSLSMILIVSATVVLSQLKYIKGFDLGYDSENLIYIDLPGQSRSYHEPFSNELMDIPGVINLTKADKPPFWGGNSTWGFDWEGKDPEQRVLICMMWVGSNYFDVMDIPIKEGSTFSERFENYDLEKIENVDVILNSEAIRRMKMENPVGKFFGTKDKNGTIVGVVNDFNFESLRSTVEPLVLLPLQNEPDVIIVRIQGEKIHEIITEIEQVWKRINPSSPFSFGFFDNRLEQMYRSEVRISKLLGYFTGIAIFIASLGLLGLSSFSIQRKTKEIGIRKVVGASVNHIVILLVRNFTWWVFISFLLACPVAWYVMNQWLQNFAYKTSLDWWMFALAGLLALFIALFTVSYHTTKAALKNPVDSLRYE